MIIKIQQWDGTTFTVEADETDYIDDLKEKIEEQEQIPVDSQRFTLDGNAIDDMDTLEANDIVADCTLVLQPLKVTLILPTKKKLRVTFKPDDLVKKIKKAVSKKTGIAVDILTLLFDGREIQDGQTMGECNVDHDDTVTVETFTLRVSHWEGDIFVFKEVNPRDTIEAIKKLVFEKTQMAMELQKYTHDERPVNEFLSLRDQQIGHKAVLDIQEPVSTKRKSKFKLAMLPTNEPKSMKAVTATMIVKHWDGRTFTVDFDPKEYIDDVRDKLKNLHGIPVSHQRLSYDGDLVDETEPLEDQGIENDATLDIEPMKVSIQAPTQKKPFKVAFTPSDKVKRIKRIVAKKCGIQSEVQLVLLDGKELKDTQSLEECGLEHDNLLTIVIFAIIVDHYDGGDFDLTDIRPTDTAEDVKVAIAESQKLPKAQIKLKFNDVIMNDFISLKDQGVRHKSRLELVEPPKEVVKKEKFKLQVFGADETPGSGATAPKASGNGITITVKKANGETAFEVDFDPMDYVDALKEKIEELHDIPVDKQRLSFEGTLLDGADTLQELNIVDGSEIVMEPMKITVVLPTGKGFKLTVDQETTIKKIKRITAKKKKLEADKLCIMYEGSELEDGKTLLGCGVEDGEQLNVETYELSVAHWTGDMFVLDDVHPDDAVDDVKLIIQKRRMIPLSDQNFKFNGKPINAFLSFKAQGIGHKSVLIMEDPQPSLFSPKSPRPSISHLKDVDFGNDLDDDDDGSDGSSVASWLKDAAMDEDFTSDLCKVEASEESWMGKQAAKEKESGGKKKEKAGKMDIPKL